MQDGGGEPLDRGKSVELIGTVRAVIYQSPESGYTVLRLDVGEDEPIAAVGTLPQLAPGERLTVKGMWTHHPSYGPQLKVESAERTLPDTTEAMYEYLASGIVRGIGPATAQAIVEHFGSRSLEVIEETPESLVQVKGITARRAREIGNSWTKQAALRILLGFFERHELPSTLAMKVYQQHGDYALEILKDDPYILAAPIFGGDFHRADALAIKLGIAGENRLRIRAAMCYTLEHNLNNGHCFIPRDKLIAATAQLLDVTPELCMEALDDLLESGRVVEDTLREISVCYLAHIYKAEKIVASRILQMAELTPEGQADVDSLIEQVERDSGLSYAPEQRIAVEVAAAGSVLIITGAPGTGKTTAVRAILGLYDRLGLNTVLAAPTGRAAKRMSELTGRTAQTIHRLLGANYTEDGDALRFEHDETNPISADALILDETSMVDILLAEAILLALPYGCRLVLVGDCDQLPSVGPGNVFADLIRADCLPVVRLTEIFRQAKESGIIRNAHQINKGERLDLRKKEHDFFFLQRNGAAKTVDTVVDLITRRLPENLNIPSHEIQVLSAFKRGEAGTINLNTRLQDALNPKSDEKAERAVQYGTMRVGDKVMQVRNNYDILWTDANGDAGQGVFNGDIGRVLEIDHRANTVTVEFDGRVFVYTADLLGELEPAWAMTVHKSQGSEYRAVIFVAEKGPAMLLTRKILYTGVTRAKEILILVGDGKIVDIMVAQDKTQKRYSGLKLRLE